MALRNKARQGCQKRSRVGETGQQKNVITLTVTNVNTFKYLGHVYPPEVTWQNSHFLDIISCVSTDTAYNGVDTVFFSNKKLSLL